MKTLRRTYARPSEANRHRRPWGDGDRRLMVPIMHTSKEGDVKSGLIRVPRRLGGSKPHTNARHELEKLISENLRRWDEMMEMRGWRMNSKPRVRGPYEPSTASEKHEADDGEYWYWAEARFIRISPFYVPFEDFLETQRLNKLFDIDTGKDVLPWNDTDARPNPKGEVVDASDPPETGWRGAKRILDGYGLKAEDYRIDKVPEAATDLLKGKTAGIG